jgi:branched-chain amino acid transport system permease protein
LAVRWALFWRHQLGLAEAVAIVAFGAGLKNVAALSVLLVFLFIRPGGILGEAK